VAVSDIQVKVTVMPTKARARWSTAPQLVQYVGVIMIGCTPDDSWGCTPPIVVWSKAVDWDFADYPTPAYGQTIAAPSVLWKVYPGGQLEVTVNW
jgi:hypothetical protein